MEILGSVQPLKLGWTFDSIINTENIGSIREPLLLTTQSGKTMIPASITYTRAEQGARTSKYFPGNFRKQGFGYERGGISEGQKPDDRFILYDEESGLEVVGLPFTGESLIFSSHVAFAELLATDSAEGAFARSISCYFPGVELGMHGSRAVGMHTPSSDLDLVIYNDTQFERVFRTLHTPEAKAVLNIAPLDEAKVNQYAQQYANQFKIPFREAVYLAQLRNRFVARLQNGEELKIGLSSTFPREDHTSSDILLGSKKVMKVEAVGRAVKTTHSSSFPREYTVEIEGQPIKVVTLQWTLRRLVQEGDEVRLKGSLRTKAGQEFISLDEEGDILLKEFHDN
jgi:hypothetical protein